MRFAQQLYWNHTSWVHYCKLAAYFQSTCSEEHLWRAEKVNSLKSNFAKNKYAATVRSELQKGQSLVYFVQNSIS